MRRDKFLLTAVLTLILATIIGVSRSLAYQSLLNKAKKFGARDCLFCHTHEEGGQGWNQRGQWLIDEREKRKAEKVDAEWLADYKPEENKEGQKEQEPEKKDKPPKSESEKEKPIGDCAFRIDKE